MYAVISVALSRFFQSGQPEYFPVVLRGCDGSRKDQLHALSVRGGCTREVINTPAGRRDDHLGRVEPSSGRRGIMSEAVVSVVNSRAIRMGNFMG